LSRSIAIEWRDTCPKGCLEVSGGKLTGISIDRGRGRVAGHRFHLASSGRLGFTVSAARLKPGSNATIISVRTEKNPFSFFLRDVRRESPIFIPSFGVAVTDANDARSYAEIELAIRNRGLTTRLQRIENEPEENYEAAAAHTRDLVCETWLGLSRDMRIFAFNFRSHAYPWDWIQPRFHGYEVKAPENDGKPLKYHFLIGRGMACAQNLTRRLEDGVLPILHATLHEEEIQYNIIAFATLESHPLTAKAVRGTHFLVADGHGNGHMFTPRQQKQFDELLPKELAQQEETVLFLQVKAINTSNVPRYAWYLAPGLPGKQYGNPDQPIDENGFSIQPSGPVFGVNKLDGRPLCQREIAVLLWPGETALFEAYVPHRPISKQRAVRLAKVEFETKHAECREFWRAKLQAGGHVSLPETQVNERVRAGLLHLDLVAYGFEPQGTLAPTIGWYNPIGSESAPIIQFFDSMGWHDVARRSLQYFLDKQHDDGFIQNFSGYMLETGPALWSMGEHWRYTRDDAWVKKIMPQLLRACDYIIRWRDRNKRPDLRGKGYGMMDGKVGDPEDPYHFFMLNGYAYLGLSRVAEMLAGVNPVESKRLAREASALKQDIRDSLFANIANSPVVPLGDGSWCPTSSPWADEDRGPISLYARKCQNYTHGSFFCRDSLVNALYLAFQEVLDPEERAVEWMLNYHAELMTARNVALSQPYYCRNDWTHLRRGEVKAFLKTYYNGFAGLADRQTYTFWEHYHGVSPHKTHEEAWFLMQTRWMLYMEVGDTLHLLSGIPRSWLEHGKRIELADVASYFGPIFLHVESKLDQGLLEAHIECRSNRQPRSVRLRLPHPQGAKPRSVDGGQYIPSREGVLIEPFRSAAIVSLKF